MAQTLDSAASPLFDHNVATGIQQILRELRQDSDREITKSSWQRLVSTSGAVSHAGKQWDAQSLGSDDGTRMTCNEMRVGGKPGDTDSAETVHRRGYTCGLWMLFHFLAANAGVKERSHGGVGHVRY